MIPLAFILASAFGGLAAIHVYWAAGGLRGAVDAIPETEGGGPLFRPGPAITMVVAGLLASAAALMLLRVGIGSSLVPRVLDRCGAWGVALALVARAIGDFNYVGFFKRRRATRFARLDTRLYSPLALALGVGAAVIAACG
jgi:Protein of unknown function (DUF3995)